MYGWPPTATRCWQRLGRAAVGSRPYMYAVLAWLYFVRAHSVRPCAAARLPPETVPRSNTGEHCSPLHRFYTGGSSVGVAAHGHPLLAWLYFVGAHSVRPMAAARLPLETVPRGNEGEHCSPLQCATKHALFVVQQPFFAPQLSAVPREAAVCPDDPVAGHDNAHRVMVVCAAHGAHGFGVAHRHRHVFVGARFAQRGRGTAPATPFA